VSENLSYPSASPAVNIGIRSLNWPYAYGGPLGEAQFRVNPEDFVVDELVAIQPSGDGEHLLLQVRKCNQNTRWVVDQLAQLAGIRPNDVGYHGMKDRRAVTTQWFSLYLGKKEFDTALVNTIEGVELLACDRHNKKLRRGDHLANRFTIRLRECSASYESLHKRLTQIKESGVPNYYGEQRFGRGANNLNEFERLFVNQDDTTRARGRKRKDRGIHLSAGRSYVFNCILAERVNEGSWNVCLASENEPTGPLWGRGRLVGSAERIAFETDIASSLTGWIDALEHAGLSQERKALQMKAEQLSWQQIDESDLELCFVLAPGCFATSLLRELTGLQVPKTL
jgi:tRNA pseudouridine13 synthase